jgi:hypothetical protein
MNKLLNALVLSSLATSAWALDFDANVNSPGPGVFYGGGNANGGWTVGTANGIELGLRTKQRYPADNVYNSGGNGVYTWTDALGNGPVGQNRSSWNYDFSLNVSGTGLAIGAFTYKLWIDSDPSAGHSWSIIDPSSIPDNAVSGTAYEQNSENARFAGVGLAGYDNTIAGSYDFVLQASDVSGVLTETYMRVNVNGGTAAGSFNGNVPDAGSSVLMLGSVLSGLALLRRKVTN